MSSIVKPPYTNEQIDAWLRGLLAIAWADGNFTAQEQELIAALTQDRLALPSGIVQPMSVEELAMELGQDRSTAENFLRTAVMVALADGVCSVDEEHLLHQFSQALAQPQEALEALQNSLWNHHDTPTAAKPERNAPEGRLHDRLGFIRNRLERLEIQDPKLARFVCKIIPAQCPFERDIKLFGRQIAHIPPLCKLNPLYEQLVGLRFKALCYLADECQEDISAYC